MNRSTGFGKRERGVSLLEALVALVVLAIGILSIAKFNAHLIEVGGSSKARAEAVALANEKIAQLRNSLIQSHYTAHATGSDASPIPGTNASFTRSWTITDSGAGGLRKQVVVLVSWTDRFNKAQQVAVESVVAWLDPTQAFSFAGGSEGNQGGKYAITPTGKATIGTGQFASDPGGTVDPTSGLKTYDDGTNLTLYDSGLNKLLVMPSTYGGFSSVEGFIYVEMKNATQAEYNLDNVQPVVSDAAYCWKGSTIENYPSSGTIKAKRIPYKCYIGAEWYGNVSVLWTANSSAPYSCLGDPAVAYNSGNYAYSYYSSSQTPALSGTRRYRGYKLLSGTTVAQYGTTSTSNIYQSTGIGVDPGTLGTYLPQAYTGQDFWMVKLTGTPLTGDDCKTKMDAMISVASTSPVNPFVGTTVGLYVCLSAPPSGWSPVYCPNPLPDVSSGTLDDLIITLNIQQPTGMTPPNSVVASVPDVGIGFACTVATAYNPSTGVETYTCELSLSGYIGGTWDAVLTPDIASGYELCASGASGNGVIDAAAGTVTFANQSVGTTTQTQSITIVAATAPSSCP